MFIFTRASSTAAGESTSAPVAAAQQQRRRAPQRRRPQPRRPVRDLSKFSHATTGHYENCAACHKIPALARKTEPQDYLSNTDVKDYPDHDACLSCHRQRVRPRFFEGARPVICAVCHKGAITPRNEAVFDFPKESIASQFDDIFPHEAHFKGSTSLPRFKRLLGEDTWKPQDSCAYCHKPNTAGLKLAATGAVAAPAASVAPAASKTPAAATPAATFEAKPGTFMTTPTSHASCFECHWKEGVDGRDFKPLANDCAQCHRNLVLPQKPVATPTPAQPVATPAAKPGVAAAHHATSLSFLAAAFVETENPLRTRHAAPKFIHELEAHKCRDQVEEKDRIDKEGPCKERVAITCLSCHTTVRKAKSLEDLRTGKQNWVQLPTCASSGCHTGLSGTGLKLSIFRELQGRRKEPAFDCAYCHLPPLSVAAEVPRSHYAVVYDSALKELNAAKAAGDEADIKRKQGALDRVKAVIPDQFKDIIKE
ncbi:MAG: hypothetical protein M3407_00705 [Acidobacteriota bacterium]|nr:hypothetical protein [Acidobacteriota bacterium]